MTASHKTLGIRQFLCGADNYGVLLHDRASGQTAAIDTPDEDAVRAELTRAGLRLTHIFTTHHHADHVAGHLGLKRETGCRIYGPVKETVTTPGVDETVKEGDRIVFGGCELQVIETPGHTLGHVAYYIPDIGEKSLNGETVGVVFAGDTLFSVGCGRVLEGSYADMWRSTAKLAALPGATLLYCGHEYTQSNVTFALAMEPDNEALKARKQEVDALRLQKKPTVPVSLINEHATNPFIRLQSPTIRASVGLTDADSDETVFEALRRLKDNF